MRISDWSSDVCSSDLAHRSRIALPRLDAGHAGLEGAVHDGCCGALVGREVGVAARHGEAVALADGRATDHLHGDRQVEDHSPHHRELLEVLLAEVGPARPDDRKRSEEHTSELQSLMRITYAVFCLKK